MWRIIVPFVQFAGDCIVALGGFAFVAIFICGLCGTAGWRGYQKKRPVIF